ncbi:MAG: hypothetical protein IT335_03395 [Thermomicrobiales bacterium]|nr:hypothetical protein [Thermomicrobiales bacterium]
MVEKARNSFTSWLNDLREDRKAAFVRLMFLVLGIALFVVAGVPIANNLFGDDEPIPRIGGDGVLLEGPSSAPCIASVSTPQYTIPDPCDGERDVAVSSAGGASAPAPDGEDPWDFCAALTVDRIDPSAGTLFGQVTLSFPQEFAKRLTNENGDEILHYDEVTGNYALPPQFEGAESPFLLFRALGRDGSERISTAVLFKEIFPVGSSAPAGIQIERGSGPCAARYRVDVPIELPLAGNPQAYPHDQYTSIASLELVVPPPLSLGVASYDFGTLVPYTLYAAAGPALDDTSVRVFHTMEEITYDVEPIQLLNIQVVLKRDAQTKLFVYSVALVPVALFLALVSILVQHRSRSKHALDGFLGFGAALLAVLPLRQVLIPGEVAGLTRIDYMLAGQLALPVATLLLVRAIWWGFGNPGEREIRDAHALAPDGQAAAKPVAVDTLPPSDRPAPPSGNATGGNEERS